MTGRVPPKGGLSCQGPRRGRTRRVPCRAHLDSATIDGRPAAMSTTNPPPPDPDDVRDVLLLVLMLLKDSSGVDLAFDALRAGTGERNDELGVTPPPAWAAANRFVLDVMIEAQIADLPGTDGP